MCLLNDSADLRDIWSDIEALFVYLGAAVRSGAGSRVKITLGGQGAVFHRPHPQKETKRRVVRNVRLFLISVGMRP